jgi:hypothetical protein
VLGCATYEVPRQRAGDEPSAGTAGDTSSAGGMAASAGVAGTGPASGSAAVPSAGNGGDEGQNGGAGGKGESPAAEGGSASEGGEGGASGAGTEACAACAALSAALVHRYDFEGTGTTVTDRVGTAHGTLVGGAMLSSAAGKGVAVLEGGATGSYVNLPNGLASSLADATFEAWVTWAGGNGWQRIFDFGDSTNASPEDNPALGKTYLFVTPMTDSGTGSLLRAVYSLNGNSDETRVDGTSALSTDLSQVALVVDAAGGQLLLYQDGQKVGEAVFSGTLAGINDVNCWLGRSQYDADAELSGTFHDFRIYDAALTAAQIAASFAAGPDPAFLAE